MAEFFWKSETMDETQGEDVVREQEMCIRDRLGGEDAVFPVVFSVYGAERGRAD